MAGGLDRAGCRVTSTPALGAAGEHLSVMVPTHNCASYLAATLDSVLRQPGLDRAHIEVVDDCSTDATAHVAASYGQRVQLHRHRTNIGMVANFNSCLERAKTPWVHILHGDDIVLDGGYQEFDRTLASTGPATAVFGRCVNIDERGRWITMTGLLGEDDRGSVEMTPLRWSLTPVQFAGVLVDRAAAAAVGGFDASRPHTTDWDLWFRLARRGPGAIYTNACVGGYRVFDGNHSSTLRHTANNLLQGVDQVDCIRSVTGWGDETYHRLFELARSQASTSVTDVESLRAHLHALRRFPRSFPRRRVAARAVFRVMAQAGFSNDAK